jgi:3-oxoacyl-[acyl-carrier protein] reductase
MKLQNRVALITGGGGTLGSATSIRLAEEGAKVMVNDINEDAAKGVLEGIKEIGGEASYFVGDVTKRKEAEKLIQSTHELFGRIDILVNFVGGSRDRLLKNMTEEDWDFVINLNLKGTFNCTQLVSQYMIEQKYGKIVNISSVAYMGNIGQSNYATAKAGIIGFTKSLSLELARYNINVNCIAPGGIENPRTAQMEEKFRQMLIDKTPLKRMGKAMDTANSILFFVSEESNYITGQVLHVAGGR